MTFTYICRTCGMEINSDQWDLAQHSLTHGQILKTDQPLPTEDPR